MRQQQRWNSEPWSCIMQDKPSTQRPNSLRKRVRFTNRIIRFFLASAAASRLFVRPIVIGRENLALEGPMIVASNHRSTFDPIALLGLITKYRRDVTFLAMAELFRNPVLRRSLLWMGIIPVARGTDAAIEASKTGITVLDARGALAIFFEGKIAPTSTLLPPKKGMAIMALATGAPIVPVAVAGTEHVRRLGTRLWHWGWRRRYAVVGKPIYCTRADGVITDEERDALTAKVMAAIQHQVSVAKQAINDA